MNIHSEKRMAFTSMSRKIIVVAAVGCSFACQTPPAPDQMARTTLQTAPADLQLICSNAVAIQAKLDGSKVLPIGSKALDAEAYTVELNASGKKFNCVVDTKGVVRSVQSA